MRILTKFFIVFLFAFLALSSAAFAQQKVVVSEGKYMLGLLDSKKDAKTLALMDAKRKAIEQAITYLEGLPEVKNYKLSKDQINTLATNITSVDVQSEDWRTSGETNISVIIPIRAVVDTSNLKDRIASILEDDLSDSIRETQNKLLLLQKELDLLKISQQKHDIAEKNVPPNLEQKAASEIKSNVQPVTALEKKEQQPNPAAETKPVVPPQATMEKKEQPVKDSKAPAEAKPNVKPQTLPDKKELTARDQKIAPAIEAPKQKQETAEVKNHINNEDKQKYEAVLKNVFALDCLEKGNIALADQRWNDAQYSFTKAIELNPAMADAYTGKSCALQNLKQQPEALIQADTALKLNPQSARTHGIKALILKDLPGKIKQALAAANEAIKLKSDSPRFYKIRGEVYLKMGNTFLAQKDFATACTLGAKESCEKTKSLKFKPDTGKTKI